MSKLTQKTKDDGISLFLQDHARNLERISINHLHMSLRTTLTSIVKSYDLTHVDLSYCSQITDEELWSLCKNNPYIKTLKLTYCNQISNSGVRDSLHMLIKLECLDIEGIKNGGTGFFVDDSQQNLNVKKSSINLKAMKRYSTKKS
jgi:hypothetical protein